MFKMFKDKPKRKSEDVLELERAQKDLQRRMDEIDSQTPYREPDRSQRFMLSVPESHASFFGSYPLRSAAILGAVIGTITGFVIGMQLDMGILLVASTLAGTIGMSLVFMTLALMAIELSDCMFTLEEHRFGADSTSFLVKETHAV